MKTASIVKNVSDFKVDDLIKHGLKSKSEMTVSFTGECHGYTSVDVRDDLVILYSPQGRTFFVSKNIF